MIRKSKVRKDLGTIGNLLITDPKLKNTEGAIISIVQLKVEYGLKNCRSKSLKIEETS